MGILKTKGTKIIDSSTGENVVLVGTAIGGHLNMENFITGYPGHETEHKLVMKSVMGEEKFNFFFDKFYEYFWTDADAKFFKSINLNCLRIPFNHRHFIDDDGDLFKIKPKGFELLDRMVKICAENEIYVILDLHTVPGGQNQGWHCDSAIHKALFWDYKVFQDAMVNLWGKIANHYKDNEWVAGYNPLNEPADSKHSRMINLYDRVEKEIRKNDPDHILFLDGNTYAADFTHFPLEFYPNSVVALHDYANYGFPSKDGYIYQSSDEERQFLLKSYNRKIEYAQKALVPVWNGEFGPVYASEVRGNTDVEATNERRYKVLRDQLAIYKKGDPSGDGSPISWSIWLYKDIGYQGMTFVSPKSKWFELLGDWLLKKRKLGIDTWGRDADPKYEKVYEDLAKHFEEVIPKEYWKLLYPKTWTIAKYVNRATRETLLSQYLTHEFASYFKDLSFEELDELAASFKFENLETRDTLNKYLANF